jgi:hypothetical protein
MNPLISSGAATITSARSPIIPAATIAGAPFSSCLYCPHNSVVPHPFAPEQHRKKASQAEARLKERVGVAC